MAFVFAISFVVVALIAQASGGITTSPAEQGISAPTSEPAPAP
jgi:hypothetical protein